MTLPFPLSNGTLITSDLLNQLVAAIEDGSIFTSTSFVSGLITTLGTRVTTLESEVAVLQSYQQTNSLREQFTMTAAQATIGLSNTPVMDSEIVALNGSLLTKDDYPSGYVGQYSISGSTITLDSSVALNIAAGDIIIVVYRYVP